MALVTISGIIPDTPGDSDLWPWQVTDSGVTRQYYPNNGVLTFQVNSDAAVTVHNPVDGTTRVCIATADTNLWTFFNQGRLVATDEQQKFKDRLAAAGVRPSSSVLPLADPIASGGFITIPRWGLYSASNTLINKALLLSHFIAPTTETVSTLTSVSANPASGGTPTLVRAGVYRVESNGDYTTLATTANDTNFLSGSYTRYTKTLSSPVSFVAGQEYAWGILVVQAAGTPTSVNGFLAIADEDSVDPRINSAVYNLTDLPTGTIAKSSSFASHTGLLYARFA